MKRANPEPDTEPTNEPKPAAKATLAASMTKRLERTGDAAVLLCSGSSTAPVSLPSAAALNCGVTIAGRLMRSASGAFAAVLAAGAAWSGVAAINGSAGFTVDE